MDKNKISKLVQDYIASHQEPKNETSLTEEFADSMLKFLDADMVKRAT